MQIETPPQFEGTLGNYPILVQDMLMRSAAFVNSLATGAVFCLIIGGVGSTIGQIKKQKHSTVVDASVLDGFFKNKVSKSFPKVIENGDRHMTFVLRT